MSGCCGGGGGGDGLLGAMLCKAGGTPALRLPGCCKGTKNRQNTSPSEGACFSHSVCNGYPLG